MPGARGGFAAAIRATAVLPVVGGLDDDRARFYYDLVYNSLDEAARKALDAMMKGYEYQSDFAKKYYGQGLADGEAKGEARGEARGKAEGEAKALLRVLRGRGIEVRDEARARILAERDPERLDRWLDRAIVASSLEEVLDEPS